MALSTAGRRSRPDRAVGWLQARSTATTRVSTAPLLPQNSAVPRVWTVFTAYLGVLAVAYWLLFEAGDGPESWLTADVAFFAVLVLMQLAIGAAAIIPARLSREPVRSRLGLVRPGLPAWGYPILALASFVPLTVGVLIWLAVEPLSGTGGGAQWTPEPMTWTLAVPFVLFVALGPGFLEELLFRGYVQRRLLQRWSPPVAILVSSLLFAVLHLDPAQGTHTFVLGLWLGVLAWRTGSVWPGIVCHAVVNGTVHSFRLVVLASSSGDPSSGDMFLLGGAALLGLSVLGLASFPVAVWLITRRRDGEPCAIKLPEPVAA